MTEKLVRVSSSFEQIQVFCKFAEEFKTDFQLPEMQKFLSDDMETTYDFVVSKYTREEGEAIVRPLYFATASGKTGDCDDGTVFWLSCLRAAGVKPSDLFVCEAKEKSSDENYCHIFAAVRNGRKMIWLDNLPGTKFGKLDYLDNRLRVTPYTDYL